MSTPDRALLDWIEEAPEERGLRFAGPGDSWDFHSYADLAEQVLRTAEALRAAGAGDGDVVAVVQRCSPGFVATFFGAIAAGCTPCSIAPPFALQRRGAYAERARALFTTARPAVIVCDDESLALVRGVTEGLDLPAPVLFDALVAGVGPASKPYPPAEFALLQFTSGSSGRSRGVLIGHDALRNDVNAIHRWTQWLPGDAGVSWLPVHHDMGLIGCLVSFVTVGCDGWMLQPDDFLRSPLRYLRCLSENKLSLTAMPNFGLVYILNRVRPEQLEGLDFGSVRSLILGAERIDPQVLEDFEKLLGPYGFDRRALLPAYGGAEATLAVTGLPIGEGWTTVDLEGEQAGRYVGCGRPLDGVRVRVVDDRGDEVPDRVVGEVLVSGGTVGTRYRDDIVTASGTVLGGGVLRTGDAGFMSGGQLFVVGRIGDGVRIRGRMVFAENLEARLHELGIPQRRVAILLGHREDRPTGVVVLEKPEPRWQSAAHSVLAEALGHEADLLAVEMPRGGIAVTSSGKPRRRVMWAALTAGELRGDIRSLTPALLGAASPPGAPRSQ
ncbi:AMP-binding protein [Kitasatospora sp. NPDC091335]|uniref:AMP-binding protein n=1 Tax=Kitasatospora sp. NPDC091335 TaxID=3364085 RepID=UPI0037F6AA1F